MAAMWWRMRRHGSTRKRPSLIEVASRQSELFSLDRDQTKTLVSRQRETQANPQVFLHNSHTGKKRYILSSLINGLYESKDVERVKGIEPSS
jgi:hypothetical protein